MGTPPVDVRLLVRQDPEPIAAAFAVLGWDKPVGQYVRYLAEQDEGKRLVYVAMAGTVFAGYVTVAFDSGYTAFRSAAIPEIADLNVLPAYRRRGIATTLLDRAERAAGERSDTVGLGVGLSSDYGAAQRLYVLRGYVPDGRGVARRGRTIPHGERVTVDDDLVLYMTKRLR